jgi:hypothetical protein
LPYQAVTSASGAFVLENVPADAYHLRVERPGFAPIVKELRVEETRTLELRFQMTGMLPPGVARIPNPAASPVNVDLTAPTTAAAIGLRPAPVSRMRLYMVIDGVPIPMIEGQPIVLVDGVAISPDFDGTYPGLESLVRPADIARVQILRGSEANALYPIFGGGDVLQIYTKKP